MRSISFMSLGEFDICVSDISCIEYKWDGKWDNDYPNGRDQNVLSFTVCGHKKLYLPEEKNPMFDVFGPSAFFIAPHSPYVSRSSVEDIDGVGHTICIKFKLLDQSGQEVAIKDKYLCWENLSEEFFTHLFQKVVKAYMEATVNNLVLKSALYKLLDELSKGLKMKERTQNGFDELLPAIKYLETNIGCNVSVEELAKMCFMSNSYFYKRFKEYTGGVCLTDYKNKMRVEKAKELLESPMWTTALIAETLGFYDTSHFYRVYKKYTGESPRFVKKHSDDGENIK